MLDLESEVHWGPRGKNFYWNILFSRSKASDANVGIIANFVYYGKTRVIKLQKRLLNQNKLLLSADLSFIYPVYRSHLMIQVL